MCFSILNLPPPPPSLLYPSGLSQSTGFECSASCIELALVIYFTYGNNCSLPGSSVHGIFQARVLEWGAIAFSNIHVSMLFSQIIPPSASPTESKSLFFISVSLLLPCIYDCYYRLSRFHIYALIHCIGVSLSDLLQSV